MKGELTGLLVRVGVDSGEQGGNWIAPAESKSKCFCYVPIRHYANNFLKSMVTRYADPELGLSKALLRFGCELPHHFGNARAHLDPDYRFLTYGDVGGRQAQIKQLTEGDFLVFYSSFRDTSGESDGLIYAIVGFYEILKVELANSIPRSKWHLNAHTRVKRRGRMDEVVVFAKPTASGRLAKFIPIGECVRPKGKKRRSYYVRTDLMKAWGEPAGSRWYVQRSRTLPKFSNPARFLRWLRQQRVKLLRRNN